MAFRRFGIEKRCSPCATPLLSLCFLSGLFPTKYYIFQLSLRTLVFIQESAGTTLSRVACREQCKPSPQRAHVQRNAVLCEFLLVTDYKIASRHHVALCLSTSDVTRISLVIRTSCRQRVTSFFFTHLTSPCRRPSKYAAFVSSKASVHKPSR